MFIHLIWGGGGAGEQGKGGVRETGEAGSLRWREAGEKFKKASFCYMLLLTSSQRNEPNNVSWLPFNVFRGLKQKFVVGSKKKHCYFLWNWKPFQVPYIIGHEWDSMTHVHVCRLCQSCQCLVCLASCRKFSVRTTTVRVEGEMSLWNGMWHGLRNDINMRNVKYGKWRKEINKTLTRFQIQI